MRDEDFFVFILVLYTKYLLSPSDLKLVSLLFFFLCYLKSLIKRINIKDIAEMMKKNSLFVVYKKMIYNGNINE